MPRTNKNTRKRLTQLIIILVVVASFVFGLLVQQYMTGRDGVEGVAVRGFERAPVNEQFAYSSAETFGLTYDERKNLWHRLDSIAIFSSTMAHTIYSTPFEDYLVAGDNFQTSKEITVWLEPEPSLDTMDNRMLVPIGSVVAIIGVYKAASPHELQTYNVAIFGADGSFLAESWISSVVLRYLDPERIGKFHEMLTETSLSAWDFFASKIATEYSLSLDALDTIYHDGSLIEKWGGKPYGHLLMVSNDATAELRDFAVGLFGERPPIRSVEPSTLRGGPKGPGA